MKKLILLIVAILMFVSSYSQCKIQGTVTYFFNEFQGNKPDVGADVYVLDSIYMKKFNPLIYYDFDIAKSYKKLYENNFFLYNVAIARFKKIEGKKRYVTEIETLKMDLAKFEKNKNEAYNELVKYNAETKEKFDLLDKSNYTNFINASLSEKDVIKTKVNGSGNYEVNVNYGTYYVLIKSSGRQGLSISEINGKLFLEKVKLVSKSIADVSENFKL